MDNEKFEHNFLEEMKWLEEEFPHIEKDYQPTKEE